MGKVSEDALRRGLEAANVRIASLEKQLSDANKKLAEKYSSKKKTVKGEKD